MTSYIMNFILQIIECFICFFFYESITNFKNGIGKRLSVMIGTYLVMYIINLAFDYNIIINTIVMLAAHFLFARFLYNISLKFSLLCSVLIVGLVTITEVGSINFIAFAFKTETKAFIENMLNYILLIVLSKTMFFIVLKIISSIINRYNQKEKLSLVYLLYPFSLLVVLTAFVVISDSLIISENARLFISACILFLTFSVIITSFYQQVSSKRDHDLFELKAAEQKNEAEMQYLSLLEEKNQQMQIMAHDYKNHIFALSQMSDISEIKSYIEKISGEIQKVGKGCESGNHTLDIILNKYVAECERKGISFEYDVSLANLCFVDDFDLVNIVSNLLDNALEAAEQSTEKKITLNTAKVNTYDSLTVINSCDIPPDKELKTTKKNKQLHGLGIKSIQKAVKKYDGELAWKYEENNKRFKATVILLNKTV